MNASFWTVCTARPATAIAGCFARERFIRTGVKFGSRGLLRLPNIRCQLPVQALPARRGFRTRRPSRWSTLCGLRQKTSSSIARSDIGCHLDNLTRKRGITIMRILVTGNDGYLGSLLTSVLLGMGHDFSGYDI